MLLALKVSSIPMFHRALGTAINIDDGEYASNVMKNNLCKLFIIVNIPFCTGSLTYDSKFLQVRIWPTVDMKRFFYLRLIFFDRTYRK